MFPDYIELIGLPLRGDRTHREPLPVDLIQDDLMHQIEVSDEHHRSFDIDEIIRLIRHRALLRGHDTCADEELSDRTPRVVAPAAVITTARQLSLPKLREDVE